MSIIDARKNINPKHILDCTRELNSCNKIIETRNDLLTFIMNYWFLNKHFIHKTYDGLRSQTEQKNNKIDISKLHTDEFRRVIDEARYTDHDDIETPSFPIPPSVPFIDYFLFTYFEGNDIIQEDLIKNSLAKYLLDNYFLCVTEKNRLLNAIDTTSMRLCIVPR